MFAFWILAGLGVLVCGVGLGSYLEDKGKALEIAARQREEEANDEM